MKRAKNQRPETIDETLLRQLRRKKRLKRYRKIKRCLFLAFLFLVSYLYLKSDFSKVNSFTVNENKFYTQEEVLAIGKLDKNTYFFTPSSSIRRVLEKDPLIEHAEITKDFGGNVTINIIEAKAIGYLIDDESKVLVCGKGLKDIPSYNNLFIPRISGFNEEQLDLMSKGFDEVDADIILRISEILPHNESYNADMIMLVMNDGNKIVCSYYSLYMLDYYDQVLPKLNSSKACLYMDDISGNIIKKDVCSMSIELPKENDATHQ